MALVNCRECGQEISSEAKTCPNCGVLEPAPAKFNLDTAVAKALVPLLILGAVGWYFLGGGEEQYVSRTMSGIEQQVAADATKQYEIAKRQGEKIQICVQAGLVAASYLQAKDEANFQIWKKTEHEDCSKAGMPAG